jgi:hypothetical protein
MTQSGLSDQTNPLTARPRLNFCTRYNGFSREACIDGVSGPPGSAVERVTIDPLDLQVAQDQEVAM